METKQTALDWLYNKLQSECLIDMADELFDQAKQIEKEQIMEAYLEGESDGEHLINSAEQYYKSTYEK